MSFEFKNIRCSLSGILWMELPGVNWIGNRTVLQQHYIATRIPSPYSLKCLNNKIRSDCLMDWVPMYKSKTAWGAHIIKLLLRISLLFLLGVYKGADAFECIWIYTSTGWSEHTFSWRVDYDLMIKWKEWLKNGKLTMYIGVKTVTRGQKSN